ncbi:MAG: STT3 domain-containing protein [Kiritimatiellae bacterium]|nr:STT3 domain-containing protein [Kiritimatiellia bacterium]
MNLPTISDKRFIPYLMVVGLLIAVLFRVISVPAWLDHPERVFLDGAPCLTSFDGYEYLRQAEQLSAGTYTANDPLRGFPDTVNNRPFPSLLSLFAAACLRLLPFHSRWIAAVLPALIGALLFPAVFLLGRQIAGTRFGLLAGLLAVCSPAFVQRSELGRFDTDCAIPAFILLAFYLANELYAPHRRKTTTLFFFFAFLLNAVLFFFWWDNAPLFAIAVFLLTLFQTQSTSSLSIQEKRKLTRLLFAVFLLATLGFVLLIGIERTHGLMIGSWKLAGQFSSLITNGIGNAFTHVAELERWPALELSARLGGHAAFGMAALVGFLAMILIRRPYRATLLSLLLLATLALFGKRFAYFAVPVYSVGLAFLLCALWDSACRWPIIARRGIYTLLSILFFTQIAVCAVFLHRNTIWPSLPPKVAEGMQVARTLTPSNALIWSWWDNGCALMYFAQRATIEDNMYNPPNLAPINALPLVLPDERAAANFIRFYAAQGLSGINRFQKETGTDGLQQLVQMLSIPPQGATAELRRLSLTPEPYWLAFLFPPRSEYPPLYLFLDYLYLPTAPVWFACGTQTASQPQGVIPLLHYFYDVAVTPERIMAREFEAEIGPGIFFQNAQSIPLSRIQIRHQKQVQDIDYHRPGLILEADPIHGWAALCSPDFHQSLFNRLFFFARTQTPHFKRIWHHPPFGQLWEITPESYSPQNGARQTTPSTCCTKR